MSKKLPPLGSDNPRTPTLREVLKPAELVGIAFILALFLGLVALVSTREPILALIGFGLAFIISLVVLAMFVLSSKKDDDERADMAEQDDEAQRRREERDKK
ncbi:MAG TPA: hypothetical protein VIJ18_05750 [Microbacteriaceae bacterium]